MSTSLVTDESFGEIHCQRDFPDYLGLEPDTELQNPLELFIRIGTSVLVALAMGWEVIRYLMLSAVSVCEDVIRRPP